MSAKPKEQRVALVTGGNRGLGLEICRQLAASGLAVILGSRNAKAGAAAARELARRDGLKVTPLALDVRRPRSIEAARQFVVARFGRLDVLVNNAAVFLDPSPVDEGGDNSIFRATPERMLETFETNALGPMRLCQAFIPLMLERGYGRVVNVSSGDAQLSEMRGGRPAYRVSKTALNALTRIFAGEVEGKNVLVNAVCPGWMQTRMGGPLARRTTEKGAETAVWLAQLPDNGPRGGFFRDLKPFAW